jgi:hypothetical protein
MAVQTTGDNREGIPMMDMNVVPLIDVLLVLSDHVHHHHPDPDSRGEAGPSAGPGEPADPPPIEPTKNKIVITDGGEDPVERNRGLAAAIAAVSRRDPADGPHSGASPPARAECPLRAGRRGACNHQARRSRQDGLRRQRGLRDLLDRKKQLSSARAASGPPFFAPAFTSASRLAVPFSPTG